MKIAVLGAAGFVGRSAAQDLSSRPHVGELILVDYNVRDAKRFAKALSPRCRWAMADAGRTPELERLLAGVDAVANAVGPCAEYEKAILLTCAAKGVSAASIGDGTMPAADRRELHDAFRRVGAAAVSGCGMMPGWTELLAAHFLPGGGKRSGEPGESAAHRYLFCSLDRFGGYAFFGRAAGNAALGVAAPAGSPPGTYFAAGEDAFGLPAGRPAGLFRRLAGGLGRLGPVGRALGTYFLFRFRGFLAAGKGTAAAAAGVWTGRGGSAATAGIEDPAGALSGILLAETALRLAAGTGGEKGLLPLPEVIGREDAERIAVRNGGKISTCKR